MKYYKSRYKYYYTDDNTKTMGTAMTFIIPLLGKTMIAILITITDDAKTSSFSNYQKN